MLTYLRKAMGYLPYDNETLLWAASDGDLHTVKQQVELGADVNFVYLSSGPYRGESCTPLQLAAEHGHEQVVHFLINHDAFINTSSDWLCWTPLHLASKNNHINIVEMLINAGAFINSPNYFGATSLALAAESKNEAMVKLLIECGANVINVNNEYKGVTTDFIKEVIDKHNIELTSNYSKNNLMDKAYCQKTDKNKSKNIVDCPKINLITGDDLAQDLQTFNKEKKANLFIRFIDVHHGWKYAESLANTLRSNTNTITHLVLNNCNITDKGLGYLGRTIRENNTIIALELTKNSIESWGLIDFSEQLRTNITLRFLNLHYNCIRDEGAIALAETIKIHPGLIDVDLSSNPLHEKGCIAIIQAVRHRKLHNNIVNIDLYDLSCENVWGNYLTMGVVGPQVAINHEFNKIENNSTDIEKIKKLTTSFLEMIDKASNLKELDLYGNSLGQVGVSVLSEIFSRVKLDTLKLSYQQGIDTSAWSHFYRVKDTLQTLCLKNNKIDDAGILNISNFIRDNGSLTSLDLESNLIGINGVKALTDALKHNVILTSLNIGSNFIDDCKHINDLARTWCGAIKKRAANTVGSIDISCNYIYDDNQLDNILKQYGFLKSLNDHVETSKINNDLKITHNNWLVFLAYNPRKNHAVIFTEGIKRNGQLFLERSELTAPECLKTQLGRVEVHKWPDNKHDTRKSLEKLKYYKYDYWERSRPQVEKMQASIEKQVYSCESTAFNRWPTKAQHNCLTWAFGELKYTDIELQYSWVPLLKFSPSFVIGYNQSGSIPLANSVREDKESIEHTQKQYDRYHSEYKQKLESGSRVELRPYVSHSHINFNGY